jgi:hypothetical protein
VSLWLYIKPLKVEKNIEQSMEQKDNHMRKQLMFIVEIMAGVDTNGNVNGV